MTYQNQAPAQAYFPNAVAIESGTGFSHDGRSSVLNQLPDPPQNEYVSGPSMPAPAAEAMPQQMQSQGFFGPNDFGLAHVHSSPQKDLRLTQSFDPKSSFELDSKLWEMAQAISHSIFVPAVIRSTQLADHSCDVYLLLLKARSLGLSATQAFTDLYILSSPKSGEAKIGIYVKTKAAICMPYGEWDVEILPDGNARAFGFRYSSNQRKEVIYTLAEAAARNTVGVDGNGQIVGVGKWSDKLTDMMKARALGRLLDALFPDVISGLVTLEDFNEDAFEETLEQKELALKEIAPAALSPSPKSPAEPPKPSREPFDLAAAVSETRLGKRTPKASPAPTPAAETAQSTEPPREASRDTMPNPFSLSPVEMN